MKCVVKLIWDFESCRWHTESDDIPGLLLESGSCDVLIERTRIAAPEMLELNCNYFGPIELRFETVRVDNLEMVS